MKKIIAAILVILLLIWTAIFFTKEAIILEWAQKDFIWKWSSEWIELFITWDSTVHYNRNQWNTSVSISGWKITEITGEYFNVGMLFINTKFVINKKPYKEWWIWKVVIDGNELIKPIDRSELIIPNPEVINKLTVKLFDMVNKGLTQNNHQYFYDNISKLWQSSITVSDISWFGNFETEAFKDFFNNFSTEKLIITKDPIINSNNLLVIEWYYSRENKLNFILKYTYEYPEWELVSFKFQ
jgi:hypothetical protein